MAATQQIENDHVIRLLKAYREKGDRRALERIFAMHGNVLKRIVRRYSGSSGESYEDLLQVGYVGLIKAVNGYKTPAARFSTYAYAMIDSELRHHFRDTALIKKPRWARSLYSKVSETTTRLTGELGRPPLVDEIARDVNVTPEGVVEVLKLYLDTNVSSLDADSDGEDRLNLSAIKSLQYNTFSLPIEDRILLEQGLETLSELQSKVVYLFFYKDLSQTEIGKRLGLPQRKVSRIIASATKSLMEKLSRRNG
jgi:RNA polymerase sigma-B factor